MPWPTKSRTFWPETMIQRIQSVFLLASFLLLALCASLLYTHPEVALGGFRLIAALVAFVFGLDALVAIFLFKNRQVQLLLAKTAGFMTLVLSLALSILLYATGDMTLIADSKEYSLLLGLVGAPFLAAILMFMARSGIQRDLDLIKSMDRIR